jgi:hypothetical protein
VTGRTEMSCRSGGLLDVHLILRIWVRASNHRAAPPARRQTRQMDGNARAARVSRRANVRRGFVSGNAMGSSLHLGSVKTLNSGAGPAAAGYDIEVGAPEPERKLKLTAVASGRQRHPHCGRFLQDAVRRGYGPAAPLRAVENGGGNGRSFFGR